MTFTEEYAPRILVPDKEVVEYRVIGPPGCGKTTWLARQCKNAAEKFGPGGVMVASLTRAAAREAAGRDTGLQAHMIGTLHAHALRALDRPALAEDKDGIKEWNEWIVEQGFPLWQMESKYAIDPENAPAEGPIIASDGEKLRAEVALLRAKMTPRELWRSGILQFVGKWDEFKKQSGRLDFTDLIEEALRRQLPPPGRPAVLMLDEAQDMSRLEMSLARHWGHFVDQLVVVGDPLQNLYEWRGSEPEAFFAGEAADTIVLSQSYRVPRAVHAYAVEWGGAALLDGQEFPEYKPRDEDGEVRRLAARWTDPEPLISSILEDLEQFERQPEWSTVMVLTSCGFMLEPLIKALRAEGIPFHNPYRVQHGGWNPMRGAERLLAFLRPDPATYGEHARMWTWDDVYHWMDPLRAKDVLTKGAKTRVKHRRDVVLDDGTPGADQQVQINEMLDLFLPEHHDAMYALDPEWWGSLQLDTRRKQAEYPLQVARKQGRPALLEKPRVILGTIHSVKGGQADSVYVFPDLSRQGFWNGWKTESGRKATVRQFYVAFTRARQRLSICEQSSPEYVPLPKPQEED